MTRKAQFSAIALIVILATTLVTGGSAGAATPTLTATPSTGLIDGQVVHVVVTGLAPNTLGGVALCIDGHGWEGCDPSGLQLANTDGSGGFAIDYAVQAILHTPLGTFDCRDAANGCGLAANTNYTTDGAALLGLTFDPTGPLLPPPTMTVTPSTGLIDRQAVAIAGENFRPNSNAGVFQCVGGAADIVQCRQALGPASNLIVAADGTLDATAAVRTLLHTYDGATTDCRSAAGACELWVGSADPYGDRAVEALAFDPDAPVAPPPTLTVTPVADLVDGQTVTVDGVGFTPGSFVGISQCASSASAGTCRQGVAASSDLTGGLSVDLVVRTQLWAGEILDCRDPAVECSIQAYAFDEPDDQAVATVLFDPEGPLLPPPVLTADPSTGLVDGQTISLTGSGLPTPIGPIFYADHAVHPAGATWLPPARTSKDETVYQQSVLQCIAGSTDQRSCSQFFTTAMVDDSGDLEGQMQVWATFTTYDGQEVDCRVAIDACELRTGQGDPLTTAISPISFDADAPLAPPPTVTVTPTTGLTDLAEMHVVGEGFPAYATVVFHQCLSSTQGLDGCDTDLAGVASADVRGHIDATTLAKQVLRLGPPGDPDRESYDCQSALDGCRLLMVNGFGPAKWTQVTLDYAGSPKAALPAAVAPQVVVQAAFTG